MNELHLQDKFLVPFFREGLGYKEVKANTVTQALIIEEDLQAFISESSLNQKPYDALLKKYKGDKTVLLTDLMVLIQERIASSRNMALFVNVNKSITLQGIKLHLFYTSDSVIHGNALFDENIFSVVQELPYKFNYQGTQIFAFRPDIVLFVNGIYLGYSELKSNYTSQTASKNGRGKVLKDYFEAVKVYHQYVDSNGMLSDKEKHAIRKDFLKIFENAIHITSTDIGETYVIRTISDCFDEILATCREGKFDREEIEKKAQSVFKLYPLLTLDAEKKDKLKELFGALYGRLMIEKEILYYNFIEREVYVSKGVKEIKDQAGHLISPRPKQKFGVDKIMSKIDEFLAHEQEPDYFEKLLEKQLAGVGEAKKKELLEKRKAYSNNKNVYSLLMQYAAGFGKSNIIGWSALQLKDLRRPDAQGKTQFVYDKIMIVVDRLQLRSQIDSLMLNMNIDKRMVIEATNKKTFQEALASDTRLVIVNLQKFGSVRDMLDKEVLEKLSQMRIVFLIDEIHRSNSGDQHEEMVSIFDELQSPFDGAAYAGQAAKKNLIIGFTATPDDHTLARFGEFSGYAESEKLWRPFDSYTMKEAIEDGFILNPLKNIVPVASKMLFDLPTNPLEGLSDKEYKDAQKKQVYENRDRIQAIAKYVADLLVKDVYRQIRGNGKAMLAVHSIKAAIAYQGAVKKYFNALVKEPKYEKYADAPIHVVYSSNQDEQSATRLNGGLSEEKTLESFALNKNGLMIVVAKLQTGFDEKKLHTLFLDKEIRGISAIQTISRVNRTMKYKNDCKIVDFSYNNVNVQNIKDAFEHFSDVVVSDFDPFGDKKVLDILLTELKKSDAYDKYFAVFMAIYKDAEKRDDPESYLDFESSLKKYIDANPQRTADIKAKVSQYFTILNRIEYVIELEAKYSEPNFLFFWRKFNTLYNMLHRSVDVKDPIEVYFDNQIGMVEVVAVDPKKKKKKPTEVAEGAPDGPGGQFDILKIIASRNEQEAKTGTLIKDFESKIADFFLYVSEATEGERLIVKIKSHVSENEIYDDFAKIYRRYKALYRQSVGDYFFKETEDLVDKLCDDFEITVRIKEYSSKNFDLLKSSRVLPSIDLGGVDFSSKLSDLEVSFDMPPVADETRYVQCKIFEYESTSRAVRRLADNQQYIAQIVIAFERDDAALIADVPFDESQLPASQDGHELQVAFCPLDTSSATEGIVQATLKTIHLPKVGKSTVAEFAFKTSYLGQSFRARVLILHKNRVLQSLILAAEGLNADLELRQENVVNPAYAVSTVEVPADLTLVTNENLSGVPGITAIMDGTATFSEPPGLALLTKTIESLLSKCNIFTAGEILTLNHPKLVGLMVQLAAQGFLLRRELARQIDMSFFEKKTTVFGHIQVVEARSKAYIPIEFVYSSKSPKIDAKLCPNAMAALSEVDGFAHETCVHNNDSAYVCPAAFWGFNKCIERQASGGSDNHVFSIPIVGAQTLKPFKAALLAASDRVSTDDLTGANGVKPVLNQLTSTVRLVDSWSKWQEGILVSPTASLLVLLPHSEYSSDFVNMPALEIQNNWLTAADLDETFVQPPEDKGPGPIVLILGCSTALGDIPFLNFVREFKASGASIVLGTLATVHGHDATRFAKTLLKKIKARGDGRPFDEILLEVKREMLAEGEPFVLSLAAYGHSSWRIQN